MKLFDAMVENSFKKTEDGLDLFYPNGIFGKGKIIPNQDEKDKVIKFLKKYYIIGSALLLFTVFIKIYFLTALAFVSLTIYYYKESNRITKSYAVSSIKLSAHETMKKASKNYGKGIIIFGIILGILLISLGILSLFLLNSGLNPLDSVVFFSFGGFILFMYLKMLHLRKQ